MARHEPRPVRLYPVSAASGTACACVLHPAASRPPCAASVCSCKTLIDDYIVPYIGEGGASDFGPLLAALLKMGCVFLFGVLCTLLYNRIMVYVSQGTMRAIRDDLFRHMERLPIRYFDTHAHGDIMSIVHQRHRHAAPDDQPEHAPARLFGGNDRSAYSAPCLPSACR